MKIYSSNETDFSKNGYGFLTDCIEAKVDESLNGDYVLNITYPLNGKLNEYLIEDNIIKCSVGDSEQLFRIQRVSKDFNEIQVYALHITYDLLNNMLENTAPTNLSCQAFGTWILEHTQFETPFEFESDISSSASARYVRKNPIEAIMSDDDNSMLNKFGGEIERDNFTIKLLQSRGQNRGVKLILGKNITEIQTIVDITSMFTKIMPIGYDGLMIPEKYVDSPLINNYPTPRITKVEFSDIKFDPDSTEEGVYTNIEDAYTALRNAARALFTAGIDKPKITIKVDWLELSKTEEYKNQYADLEKVRLGDTLTAQILGFDYTTKCTKTTYNVLTDMFEKFEIGTIQKTIANTINQTEKKVEEVNPSSILSEAKQDATNLINGALGGYIYLDYETGNLYIMDTDNPQTAQKVWRWNLNGLGYSSTGINGTYGIAMTMDGQIVADFITTGTLSTSVINGYDSLTLQVRNNTSDIATIKAEISDIADITTSSSSTKAIIYDSDLQNIAVSNPIRIEIAPINTNISYLYPSNGLFPSDTLFMPVRTLKFTNTSTNEVFTYELPQDLLYYNSTNYDELVADYETDKMTITKKCGYAADGSVVLLDEPVITEYDFSETIGQALQLTEGNYQVELVGYTEAYIMVRLMVLNAYTAQYATKIELNNAVTINEGGVDISVKEKINQMDGTIDEIDGELALKVGKNENNQIVTMLNASANDINITGDRIAIDSTNFKLSKNGDIEATNANLSGTITSTNGKIGNWDIGQTYLKSDKTIGSYDYRTYIQSTLDNYTEDSWIFSTQRKLSSSSGGYEGLAIITMGGNIEGTKLTSKGNLKVNGKLQGYLNLNDSHSHWLGEYGMYFSDETFNMGQVNTYTQYTNNLCSVNGSIYANNKIISKANVESYLNVVAGGDMYAQNFYPTSLEKSKKNIEKYNGSGIDIIKNTDIYTYNLKTENDSHNKHTGFVIGKNYKYANEIVGYDNNNKAIGADIYAMTSISFKAIQELNEIIENQQQQINELKQEIQKMKESDK